LTLRETVWRGVPAWTLESDRLRVVTTPSIGAKITSIYDKTAAHEWLVAPADRPFGPLAYAAPYIEQDMSGWDEMYPTIKPCTYPVPGPYAGTALPDHGEVWALPWQVESTADEALTLTVEGRALPYRLSRTLALCDDATVNLHYVAANTGLHPIAALWAAHPQFTATPRTRIRLPDRVTELYNVRDIPAWGDWGLRYAWPETTDRHGTRVRLDRVAPPEARTCRKMYVPPETPIEWAGLVEEGADHGLLMQWKPAEIPYLGIWVDEGAVNSVPTAALEITDGFHDSLETAWENQRCPVIAPGGQRQWQVVLRVGEGLGVDSPI
jgi:galactose mutarotase-like enzyme